MVLNGTNQTQYRDEKQDHSACQDATDNGKICNQSWRSSIYGDSYQYKSNNLQEEKIIINEEDVQTYSKQ